MSDLTKNHFDFIIVGSGLAGLQLALAMASDEFFKDKRIAIIDPEKKNTNDKTWCFWEIGSGHWESIIHKTWRQSRFISLTSDIEINLSPYSYKMVRSIDFYSHIQKILMGKNNFLWFKETVEDITELHHLVQVKTSTMILTCNHVFDSQIPPEFYQDTTSTKIQQHFKGYFIQTRSERFNPERFTVMDYRLRHEEQTSFTYILPFSKNTALVEYTFFTTEKVDESTYDEYLKKYISEYIGSDEYEVLETELGVIPMTDFDFEAFNTKKVTKIGTAGGWVKGSTGYSFKHTEKKIEKIIDNLTKGLQPSTGLSKARFRFYDKIFLDVLKTHNDQGPAIFEKFYSKNKPIDYLAFLDETSNFKQEINILNSLFSIHFVSSFLRQLKSKFRYRKFEKSLP